MGNKIKIFISFPSHVRRGAETLKSFIEMYGNAFVSVFTSESDPTFDSDWSGLVKRIEESGLMILLWSDNLKQWNWGLYEAGIYIGTSSPTPRPLVVFHPAYTELPNPLRASQSVPLDYKSIRHFLHSFFAGELTPQFEGPINEKIVHSEREINRASEEILEALESDFRVRVTYYQWTLMLTLNKEAIEQLQKSGEIPEFTAVEMASPLKNFFGIAKDEVTWNDLRNFFQKNGEPHLIGELNRNVASWTDHREPTRLTATFRSISNGNIYRPFWSSTKESANELSFRFILVEEPAPALIGGPGDSGTLFMLLRIALRFKWEVIEPYINDLESNDRQKSLDQLSNSLRSIMEQISREAADHGFLVKEVISTVFENYEERKKIEELLYEWQQNVQRLNTSIDQTNGEEIKRNLFEFKQFNDRFTAIVAKRYSELVRV